MIYDKDSLISHSHKELDIDDLFFWAAIELDRHREKRFYLPAARSGIMQSHRSSGKLRAESRKVNVTKLGILLRFCNA